MSFSETISKRISFLRTERGLTLEEVGSKMEQITGKPYPRNKVWSYENNKLKVPAELIPVFAKIFDITTDELFYESGQLEKTGRFEGSLAEYRRLVESNPEKALEKATEIVQTAQAENIHLREQLTLCQQENEKYKKENAELKKFVTDFNKFLRYAEKLVPKEGNN